MLLAFAFASVGTGARDDPEWTLGPNTWPADLCVMHQALNRLEDPLLGYHRVIRG